MLKNKLSSLLTALVSVSLSMSALGVEMITKEYELDNGLKVVVREDHRAPVVVAQVWYKVGSADEYNGITGISHILEHIMFKGTEKYPKDMYAQIISKNGGYENAFTSEDYTAYYTELDASKLELSMELEADRMQNLAIDPKLFEKELEVVKEERRLRTDDNPQNVTFERFLAAANVAGPYHHPVIGWMHDIEQITTDDLNAWYDNWYGPSNAVLVVVGDVNPDNIYELAKKYFGPVKKGASKRSKDFQEIPQLGEMRLKVNAPAKLPFLMMGFAVPTSGNYLDDKELSFEPYALTVAAEILDGGESARIPKNLIRKKEIALAANIHYEPFKRYGTQFILMGTPTQKRTVDELEKAFWEEINRLKTEAISEKELKRVKTQIIADEIFGKDSMSQQAIMLGAFESIGLSWKDADQYVERIKAVTPEQVQAVAKKYFVKDKITVAELVPQSMEEGV